MIKDLKITLESIPLNFFWKNLQKLDDSEFPPFTAEQFQNILCSDIHECLFQNHEKEKKNPCYILHVALSCYNETYFVRMKLVLKESVDNHQSHYLFFVPDVQFVNHLPASDAISAQCSFDSVYDDDNKPLDDDIRQLLTEIEQLEIPKAEIDKERDKHIWDTYLRALRQKVLQKERIWCIKDINIANKQIIIQDDETKSFRQKVSDQFGEDEGLKSVIFPNETVAYVSFEGEHLHTEDERNELINIARHFSFKMDDKSPQKLIRCLLKFRQQDLKRRVLENITNNLSKKGYSHIGQTDKKSDIELRFMFRDAKQRDKFINDLQTLIKEYNQAVSLLFVDGELGVTQYMFKRDAQLLDNQEKSLNKDLKEEKFVFYTQKEFDQYQKIKTKGEGTQGPDGINVGTFVKKKDCYLTFEFSDEFIAKLDEIGTQKLLEKGGYILPVFAGELANIGRMQNAMNKIIRPFAYGYPANWNLANFIFDSNDIREPLMDIDAAEQQILSNPLEKRIIHQKKQIEAVAKAIAAQDLAIIQGPPGTGKTTVIAEIIWQTISQNPDARILITSQTNLAVDNAIARLEGKKNVFPLRSGLLERFEEEGKIYSYNRISKWIEAKNKEQEKEHENNVVRKWMLDTLDSATASDDLKMPVSTWQNALHECSESLKLAFYDAYIKHVNVIGATCSESGSNGFANLCRNIFKLDEDKTPEFDLVIMDEASKTTPPELILPLTLGKKVIIIGDHKQLPPMLDDGQDFDEAMEAIGEKELAKELKEQKISQFEKLFVNAPDFAKVSLDTQFRMHEQIMNCIKQFYADQKKELENGLICGIKETQDIPDLNNKSSRYHGLTYKTFIKPEYHAIWVDINSPERKKDVESTSFYNEGEITAIKTVLNLLMKADGFKQYMNAFSNEDREIGIITYYAEQKNELEKALKDVELPLRINTVDKFQGMERNIVIVSTVRSNRAIIGNNKEQPNNSELGFAKEPPRINVGFSRAKRLLIVVGNKLHFEKNKTEYKNAIHQMEHISFKTLQNL